MARNDVRYKAVDGEGYLDDIGSANHGGGLRQSERAGKGIRVAIKGAENVEFDHEESYYYSNGGWVHCDFGL